MAWSEGPEIFWVVEGSIKLESGRKSVGVAPLDATPESLMNSEPGGRPGFVDMHLLWAPVLGAQDKKYSPFEPAISLSVE